MKFHDFKKKYELIPVKQYPNEVGKEPIVSVCVITYNHASYIKDCLESILMQKTDFPIEILLGEDDSYDGTREICIDFAQRYPDKIRLFLHHRKNNIDIGGKPSGAFSGSYNLYSARGKYIALCDGDDYWTDPLKLQKQVEFIKSNPSYTLTYHSWVELKDGEFRKPKSMFASAHTLLFKNIDFFNPMLLDKALNGDIIIKFMLNHHGNFKFLDNIKPAVKRRDTGGIWNSLSDEEKIYNKYETAKQMYIGFRDSIYEKRAIKGYIWTITSNRNKLKKIKQEYRLTEINQDFRLTELIKHCIKERIFIWYLKKMSIRAGVYLKSLVSG